MSVYDWKEDNRMKRFFKCSAAALLAASLFSMSGQSVNAATGYQRLTHNAYAYTYAGKRANKKLYRKGSRVKVIGSATLNGKKYNIISGNVYIKASNFNKRSSNAFGNGYETQLLHNSYVYNAKGQRVKGAKLHKGHSVTCYGNPVRIHGKKYIQIGNGQFVRLSNVLYSYDGPMGSDSMNHKHHNTSSNTSSTTKRNSSNGTQQSTTPSNGSSTNSSSKQSSSSGTSGTTNGSSTTNKSTSSTSTTDKKSPSKSDTSKKDSSKKNQSKPDSSKKDTNKPNQSKSDSKTQPSKSTDNKNTGKEDTNAKPTQADYNALSDAIVNARNANFRESSYAKQKIYDAAMEKAINYLESRNYSGNHISRADIRKVTSELNTAVANLDWKAEIAKFPTITVETDKNGNRKWDWTPDEETQVLDIVNEIYGSSDAHFLPGRPNNDTIVYTQGGGWPEKADTREFVRLVLPNGRRVDF